MTVHHLYVHIPFCHRICPYCGFYKHLPENLANAAFVDALLAELDQRIERDGIDLALKTIYFGGGTPSLLSRSLLERLCTGISERNRLRQSLLSDPENGHPSALEWSIEANPRTFGRAKMNLLRELGVTRVSLGVQSWQPHVLKTLGRDHSPADAEAAFETLRETGFESLSIDQMFSIPGQSLEDFSADLETSLRLAPDHLSCYNLTYEEDTEFLRRHHQGELDASEDRDATHFHYAIRRLSEAGFTQYEISNYAALPKHESQHNRAYWSSADFLGIGPGAVSTIGDQRWKTLPDTARYVEASSAGFDTRQGIETITPEDRRLEKIGLQIRLRDGLPLSLIGQSELLPELRAQGLLVMDEERLYLTGAGKPLADEIASALI